MLGLLIVAIAGLSIRKLWPGGVIFLVAWPAVSLAIMLPVVSKNRAMFGETLDLSPASLGIAYLQSAALTAIVFFIFFGIRRIWNRFAPSKSGADAQN